MIKDNNLLEKLEFIGVFLVFCVVFQIEVIFDIDVNSIFNDIFIVQERRIVLLLLMIGVD